MIRIVLLLLLSTAVVWAGTSDYGAPMPEGEAVPLAAVLAAPAEGAEVKVEGRITEVCQKEGCWLVLADGTEFARVKMKDHAFGVPSDANGRAQVYGTLSVVEVEEAEAEHLVEDGATAPAAREYRIEAVAVRLLD